MEGVGVGAGAERREYAEGEVPVVGGCGCSGFEGLTLPRQHPIVPSMRRDSFYIDGIDLPRSYDEPGLGVVAGEQQWRQLERQGQEVEMRGQEEPGLMNFEGTRVPDGPPHHRIVRRSPCFPLLLHCCPRHCHW